jgi:hypothetical protein
MNFLRPYLQIERGRVESVGAALRLYRFRRFDLTVCFSIKYPRVAITFHENDWHVAAASSTVQTTDQMTTPKKMPRGYSSMCRK